MKNYFIGLQNLNVSPCFVNREIYPFLKKHGFKTHYRKTGLLKRLSSYFRILTSGDILISGIFVHHTEIRLMRLLGKKYTYLMHGSAAMETGVLHPIERLVLENARQIVSVSAVHARMIRDQYPEYAHKVVEWFNGINWEELDELRASYKDACRDPNKIILIGGGRTMKGNLEVCRAVEELNREKGMNLRIDVYGELLDDDLSPQIRALECVDYHSVVPREEILKRYAESTLFVANSLFDTFNLAVIEALGMGASVLFSKNVGVRDIIAARTDDDVIDDVTDIDEIKRKILNVLMQPNNARLLGSIDRETTSWQARAEQLRRYVDNM